MKKSCLTFLGKGKVLLLLTILVLANRLNAQTYCTSIPTSATNEEITNVTVNGSAKTSDCFTAAPGAGSIVGRYSNWTPLGALTNLIVGITVDFNIQVAECDAASAVTHGCAIWIDFNQDGDFTDPFEQVYVDAAQAANPRTIFGNITVPAGALPGPTRMRIIVASGNAGNALTPCMTYTNGETEDYLVNIIPNVDCSGLTNAGTSTANPASACVGQPITLTNTGASVAIGQDYQWQVSTDLGATWTNIAGATNFQAATTQPTATSWYRFKITCTSTGDVIYSTVAQVSTPLILGGTYTINKNETNPANIFPNGTVFVSFATAYDALKCGISSNVIFNVLGSSGPYNEQLIMNGRIPNAAATRTITFNGNGNTITFNTTTAEKAVIKIKNIEYIRFENLVIVPGGADNGFGVHLTGDANFNIIRNCTINISSTATTTSYAGIAVSGSETDAVGTGTTAILKSDNNEFLNNTITGGYYGLTLASSFTNGAHGNNRFYGNKVTDYYGYGIYVAGTFGTVIDSNFFSRPSRTSAPAEVVGIHFTTQSNSSTVSKNRISNPFGGQLAATATFYGINFSSTSATTGLQNNVTNNLIFKMNGNGPVRGINNVSSANVWYIHNTVSIDSLNTNAANTRGFSQDPAAGGIIFFNNLISVTRNGPGVKYAIYLAGNQLNCNYNNYYRSVTGATGALGFYTADRATIAAWQAATGFDANGLSVAPVFVNPNDGIAGYMPGNGGLNNQGQYFGIDNDILGVTRPFVTPDIGAFEFNPPGCTLPVVNGSMIVSPSGTVCQGELISMNLNIGAYGSGQTFQWQSATVLAGPYANVGDPKLTPDTTIIAAATLYFRVQVSCGASSVYSDTVLLNVNPAFPGGTYTINNNNPTTYNPLAPAAGTNFNSFNAAKVEMSKCGILGAVVFNVANNAGNPYREKLLIDSIRGISAINTITFNGNGATIMFNPTAPPSTNDRAVFKLNAADYITVDSLVIDAATGAFTFGNGVQLLNNADFNTFRRCKIIASATTTSQNYNGIVISPTDAGSTTSGNTNCDNNLFERDSIIGGFYGIMVVGGNGTANPFINDNRFIRNTVQDFYTAGIYISGTFNNLVEGSVISRPARTAVANPSYGIMVTDVVSQRLNITKNRIRNLFGGAPASTAQQSGIYFNNVSAPAGNDNIVSNNVISDLDGAGIIYALHDNGSNSVKFQHNTISLDNLANTSNAVTRGLFQAGAGVVGVEFVDNIVTIRRGGTGAKHGIYIEAPFQELQSNYNDIYVDGLGGNNFFGFSGANHATLADWQNVTNDDDNSFAFDPIYVSPSTGNYSAGLAAIDNKGTWVGVVTDINNVNRNPITPDIGAYEFVPVLCVNPPIAGTATVTPSASICLETPLALSLSGNSPLGSLQITWQSAPTLAGPWTNISPVLYTTQFFTVARADTFFRAQVQCGNGTPVYSTVAGIHFAPVVFAGTYTIDNANATTWPGPPGSNFNSFNAAVAAMQCGITGPVVFNVRRGTTSGVYSEQVSIPYIKNSSAVNTITFQSESGNAADINLTNASTIATANYTLRLDSVRYVTFRNLTISATNTGFGRAVELSKGASFNTITRCIVNLPVVTVNTNSVAGIYANALKGVSNIIRRNTVNNGSMGIYFWGTGIATDLTVDHIIDSNTVSGAYAYGINASFMKRAKLIGNTVNVAGTGAANAYGIYGSDLDSSYTVTGNKVNISNATTTVYGVYINNSDTARGLPKAITSNTITGVTGNSGPLYGLYVNTSPGHEVLNNVIALRTSNATTNGLYTANIIKGRYYNNSVNITSPIGAVNNTAAYINTVSTDDIKIQNNIFANNGSGRAMVVTSPRRPFASDYNMLYAAGTVLVQSLDPAVSYNTLNSWITGSYWDRFSIVYKPAFVNDADLHPNLSSPDVWAMHGRGVQIPGNDRDFNNNLRPTTLTTGVPDLGAYEFYPTSLPTLLTPSIPGAPAPGLTQTFMYGTDTVTKITWGANVPPTAGVRRFSGVVPSGLAGPDSMYFYTQVETPGNYDYGMDLFYLNPWQGSIPEQWMIGLGRTTPGNAWVVGFNSRVTVPAKRITQTDLTYMDKFTGLINPFAPPILPDKDSSNRGRRFWVAYAINQLNKGSNQEMVLYLSAQEPANVTVKINGTTWERNYLVPANTVVQTEFLPKNGADDAFLNTAGLHERGINIESDVPIVVYAHATGSASSGAAMLLPVSVWGYEYKMLGVTQNYGGNSFSYFYAVADNDNTVIEVTPTVPVQNAGMTPNVPYTVTLNKGQVFQVVATSQTQDLTGSTVKSISNNTGTCYPVAVFSGTSRTALALAGCGSGGDFMMQQNFPATAWGKRYLTAPSSSSQAANDLRTNVYRVAVRDPATVVKVNGNLITAPPFNSTLVNNHYYQFLSNTADFIEADKPIMVAQYLTGACGGGVGDPEMIYISPVEQAINSIGFYRNDRENIDKDLLTMIIPTNGLATLKITDGFTNVTPDFVYPHPQSGSPALRGNSYSVVVKMWEAGQEQVRVTSDSNFTAITYGLGSVESYGYNAGTLVKNINATSTIRNTLNTLQDDNDFTCVGSQFKFSATLQLIPEVITFKLSAVPNLSPNADVTVINPVPVDTIYVNWTAYYVFELPNSYSFSQPGIYPVQIIYRHPDIEGCNDEGRDLTYVQVVPAPVTDFAVTFAGCVGGTAQFRGDDITSTGSGVSEYEWTFHNGTSTTGQTTTFTYPAVGSYDVKLKTLTPDGCVGDNTKAVVVNPKPTVDVVQDALTICTGSNATWQIQNPVAGVDYIWYYTPTGGTAIDTTNTFTVTGLATNAEYYVEAKTTAGCVSEGRKRVSVTLSSSGAVPVVTVSATGPDFVTFSWPAIPGTSGYQVSTNGGTTFVTPSSGPTGLTHTASGLSSLQTISLIVKSLNACGDGVAVPVSGCASTPVRVGEASLAVCEGANAVFNVQTPVAGVNYTWFNSLTGGAALATGPSFTTSGVTGSGTYYVEQQLGACIGAPRTPVAVSILPPLDQAGIIADSIGVNAIRFRWSAVPGAAGYQVSRDGGITFITPSSGATGLTHTVTGLQPAQEVTLMVKAIGSIVCQESVSQVATARTLVDDIFIPNTFTPNGDGLNDVFRVYGNIIQEVNIMVFNQWGEKVYHGRDRNSGWDGRFKGKPQPSGVYIVVAQFILADGSMISRKASLNLIR